MIKGFKHMSVERFFLQGTKAGIQTSAESWSQQQAQYDLWRAEQRRGEHKVKKLSAA